jgi:hypothetical protein
LQNVVLVPRTTWLKRLFLRSQRQHLGPPMSV